MARLLNSAEWALSTARGDRLAKRSAWLLQREESMERGDLAHAALIDLALAEQDVEIEELTAAIRAAFPDHKLTPLPPLPAPVSA